MGPLRSLGRFIPDFPLLRIVEKHLVEDLIHRLNLIPPYLLAFNSGPPQLYIKHVYTDYIGSLTRANT